MRAVNGRAAGMVTAQINGDKAALVAALEGLSIDELAAVIAELTVIAGYAVRAAAELKGSEAPDLWREMLSGPLPGVLGAQRHR